MPVPLFRTGPVVATLCFPDPGRSGESGHQRRGDTQGGAAPHEVGRVDEQISLLEDEIASTGKMLRFEGFDAEADILQTHVLILNDAGLRDKVVTKIQEDLRLRLVSRLGVRAIITEVGTSLSHAAIMAKAFNIPVLRVPGIENLEKLAGTRVVVDSTEASSF